MKRIWKLGRSAQKRTEAPRILLASRSIPPARSGSAVVVGNLIAQFTPSELVVVGSQVPGTAPPQHTSGPEIVPLLSPPSTRRWIQRAAAPLRTAQLAWRMARFARRRRITHVLVVFPDGVFLFAAWVTSIAVGGKLFPYFHNTYRENSRGVKSRLAGWLQPRVFAKASHVFVISEGMRELFVSRYPGLGARCTALRHTILCEIPKFEPPPTPGHTLRCILIGHVNHSCLDATKRLHAAVTGSGHSLTFFTQTPHAFLKEHGLLKGDVTAKFVATEDLLTELERGDVLLLPNGLTGLRAQEEYETIFPTRTLDYLLARRPILAHSPRGAFLTRFLREQGCALVVDTPSESALVDGLQKIQQDPELRKQLVERALATAKQFQPRNVVQHLREVLDAPGTPSPTNREHESLARH